MNFRGYFLLALGIMGISLGSVRAQKGITTAGFQIKPIFSSDLLNTDSEKSSINGVDFFVQTTSGYSGGMVIRHGITGRLSIETGIGYTKRNYELAVKNSNENITGDFSIVSYEIPLMGMVFIQLWEKIWMTTALGLGIDMFASDIFTSDESYKHLSLRRGVIVPAFAANLGYEYRTDKSGYFYFGATFHRPFEGIYNSRIQYLNADPIEESILPLSGTYGTIDFRYFFHQDPNKVKKKEMSVKKRKRLYRKLEKQKEQQ